MSEIFDELKQTAERLKAEGYVAAGYFVILATWATDDAETLPFLLQIDEIAKRWHRSRNAKQEAKAASLQAVLTSINRQKAELQKQLDEKLRNDL